MEITQIWVERNDSGVYYCGKLTYSYRDIKRGILLWTVECDKKNQTAKVEFYSSKQSANSESSLVQQFRTPLIDELLAELGIDSRRG